MNGMEDMGEIEGIEVMREVMSWWSWKVRRSWARWRVRISFGDGGYGGDACYGGGEIECKEVIRGVMV